MKTFALVLFLLLAVQTWGVVGAWRTNGIRYKCTLELGPLCYTWEETSVSKLLGDEKIEEIEDALGDAKDVWEKEVVEKISNSTKKAGIDKVLDDVSEMAKEGAENAKKVIEDKVK
jgi:hypothetical protein